MLYVSRPKEKKEFKTLQKLLGLGKIKSGEPPMPKLNFQVTTQHIITHYKHFITVLHYMHFFETLTSIFSFDGYRLRKTNLGPLWISRYYRADLSGGFPPSPANYSLPKCNELSHTFRNEQLFIKRRCDSVWTSNNFFVMEWLTHYDYMN